jgi:hypothetical protein
MITALLFSSFFIYSPGETQFETSERQSQEAIGALFLGTVVTAKRITCTPSIISGPPLVGAVAEFIGRGIILYSDLKGSQQLTGLRCRSPEHGPQWFFQLRSVLPDSRIRCVRKSLGSPFWAGITPSAKRHT